MSRDIDWYSEIIQVDGEPKYGTKVDAAYAEAYRGRLPDFLLRFWTEFGFGTLGNGMLWLCDPVLLAPVMETVFAGDPEFAPADILAVTYDAYGRIGAYHPQYGGVTVDCVQEYWALYSQETLTSKLPMENDVGSLLAPPEDWVDDSGEELFPQAVARLGLLNYGEVYGFFPALKIGGELRRERQMEGIAAAKARGVYKGRRPELDAAEIRRLRDEEKLGATAIARRLGIGRASVYRIWSNGHE